MTGLLLGALLLSVEQKLQNGIVTIVTAQNGFAGTAMGKGAGEDLYEMVILVMFQPQNRAQAPIG